MKNNKIRIAVVYLIPSLLILSSCVGSITNNIEKIEGKIDSKINAEAKVNTNVDTKVNANLSTGNILTQPNQSIVKDLDRFSELRVKNESNLDISFNRSQSRLFDDYKKIESFSFDKVKLKGNLNSYIEIVYDNDGIKYSNNLTFEYKESSNKVSLIIKSNGDFETINNGGGGELIVRDIKNNITKKLSVSVYDVSLESKNEPIFTRPSIQFSSPTPTATPSTFPTVTPTLIQTPLPIPTSNISQIKPRISGKIFDINASNVPLVTVNLKLDGKIISTYETEGFTNFGTTSGYFEFNNLLVGKKYSVEVLKQGWTTKVRDVLTESEGINYPLNFQGDFAIQDEPEIIETKINSKIATFSGGNDNPPTLSTVVTLPDLQPSDLKVEINFSEPISTSDIESNFKIISVRVSDNKKFILDNNLRNTSYSFSEDKRKFTAIFSGLVLSELLGKNQKIIARVDFERMFKDLEGREAIKDKCFNFGTSKAGYTTFSFLTLN